MVGALGFLCLKTYNGAKSLLTQETTINALIGGETLGMDYFLERYITISLSEKPNLFGEDRNSFLKLLYAFKDFLSESNTELKIEKYKQLCQDYATDEYKGYAFLVFLKDIFKIFGTEHSAFYAYILRAYVVFMLKQYSNLDITQDSEAEITYILSEIITNWEHMYTYEDEISKVATVWALLAFYVDLDQRYINEIGQSIFSFLTEEQLKLLND
ncbi:hypothetical protein [Streptococcus suis]|uniref:hypothetical protein n=1 Tax=Streptococcus suis TaxID=1307 RepID=UPI002A7C7BA5|nr:hypothetical protein [Streptococcus suis]